MVHRRSSLVESLVWLNPSLCEGKREGREGKREEMKMKMKREIKREKREKKEKKGWRVNLQTFSIFSRLIAG